MDPWSSWAQALALSQQGCCHHTCFMRTYTHVQMVSRLPNPSVRCLRPPGPSGSQPTDPLASPESSFGIWLQWSYPNSWASPAWYSLPITCKLWFAALRPQTHIGTQNRTYLTQEELEMEFNEMTGQTVLTRHRARPDPANCLHATGTFYLLIPLLSHSFSAPFCFNPSLSPPLVPPLSIP